MIGPGHSRGIKALRRGASVSFSPQPCGFKAEDADDAAGRGVTDGQYRGSPTFAARRRLVTRGGVAVSVAITACAPSARAQGVTKAKHGDWQVRCETPPGAQKEMCALIQSIVADDRPNIGLVVIVLKTADGKNRLLRVIAPLGVLLPSGLGLKIDQTDIGHAGFVRCQPSGCIAEVVMEDKLLQQFQSGKTAVFIISQTPEEGVGIPLQLAGFKEAFEDLH